MKQIYNVKEVIENLDKLDDYYRTENDNEQNAIKIAKFVLKSFNDEISFKIENSKVEQINLK